MSTFNNSTSSVSEIEASYTPNEYLKFNSGINQSIEFAKATAFEGTKKNVNRSALFGSATFCHSTNTIQIQRKRTRRTY